MKHLSAAELVPQSTGSSYRYRPTSAPSAKPKFSVCTLVGENVFESFATRFQVYCCERKFLDRADYPDGLESDEFDWISAHIGAFDANGAMAGTVRLVPRTSQGLPLDGHCAYDAPAGAELGEISRLAVPRGQAFGAISLQLYRGLYQTAREASLTHLLSAMEPSLERLVRRMHFPFEPIGPLVDYYGWVRPYALDLDALDRSLAANAPEIHRLFHTPLDRRDSLPLSARRDPHRYRPEVCAA